MNADHPSGHSTAINAGVTTNVLSANEQWERTAVAAFFIAESRGFEPGFEWDDWFAAERQLGHVGPSVAAAAPSSGLAESAPGSEGGKKLSVRRPRKTAAKAAAPEAGAPKKKATSAGKTAARVRKSKASTEARLGGVAS